MTKRARTRRVIVRLIEDAIYAVIGFFALQLFLVITGMLICIVG